MSSKRRYGPGEGPPHRGRGSVRARGVPPQEGSAGVVWEIMSYPPSTPTGSRVGRNLNGDLEAVLSGTPSPSPSPNKSQPHTEAELAYPSMSNRSMIARSPAPQQARSPAPQSMMYSPAKSPAAQSLVPSPPRASLATSPGKRVTAESNRPVLRASIAYPQHENDEALVFREKKELAGLYGVGLKVDTDPPHTVQRVHDLLDPKGNNISHKCSVGDVLTFVDDSPIDKTSTDALEEVIVGDYGTIVKLSFSSKATGRMYDLNVKRHVGFKTWEAVHQWFEVTEDVRRSGVLFADLAIVPLLESMRLLVTNGAGGLLDMLAEKGRGRCTVGVQLAVNSRNTSLGSRQIQGVIPGSSAHLVGNLAKGDEVILVDGESVTGENLQEKIRGCSMVGSRCTLTVDRQGRIFDVWLTRQQISNVRSVERILDLIDTVTRIVKKTQMPSQSLDSIVATLEMLHGQIVNNERRRLASDENLAHRVNALECAVFEHISAAESHLHPSVGDAASATTLRAGEVSPRGAGAASASRCANCRGMEEKMFKMRSENLEYRALRSDFADVSGRLEQVQSDKGELEKQVIALKRELEVQRQVSQQLEERESEARRALDNADGELSVLRPEVGSLREQLRSIKESSAAQRRDDGYIKEVEKQSERLKEELRVEERKRSDAELELASSHRKWAQKVGDAAGQADGLRGELARVRAEVEHLKGELEDQVPRRHLEEKSALSRTQGETIAKLEVTLKERGEAMEELEAKLSRANADRQAAEREVEAARAKDTEHKRAFESLGEKHRETSGSMREMRALVASLQEEAGRKESVIATMREELDGQHTKLMESSGLRARVVQLESVVVELRGVVEKSERELKLSRDEVVRIEGILRAEREDATEMEALSNEKASATRLAREMEGKVRLLEQRLEQAQAEAVEVKQALETAAHEKDKVSQLRAQAAEQARKLGQSLESKEGELANVQDELRDADERLSNLQKLNKTGSQERSELLEKVKHLEGIIEGKEAEISKLEQQVNSLGEEKKRFVKKEGELKTRVAELEAISESRDAEIVVHEKTIASLSESKKQLTKGREELQAMLQAQQESLSCKASDVTHLSEQIKSLEESRKALRASVSELTRQLSDASEVSERRESERRALQQTISNTTSAKSELAREANNLREQLCELEGAATKREADLSALSLQVDELVEFKRVAGKEREALERRVSELEVLAKEGDAKGSELSKCIDELRDSKAKLSKLETAMSSLNAAHEALTDKYKEACKSEMELIKSQKGIEERDIEIKNMAAEVSRLEEALRESQGSMTIASGKLQRLETSSVVEAERLRCELVEKSEAVSLAREEAASLRSELEGLRVRVSELQVRAKESAKQETAAKDRIAVLEEDKAELETSNGAAQEKLSQVNARLLDLMSQLGARGSEVSELRGEVGRLERQCDHLIGEGDARQREVSAVRVREGALEAEVARLEAECCRLRETVAVLRAEVGVLSDNNANIRDALASSEGRVMELTCEVDDREDTTQDLMRELSVSRQRWDGESANLRLALQAREADLKEMEARMEVVTRGEAERAENVRKLQADVREIQGEKESLRREMQDLQQSARESRLDSEAWKGKAQASELEAGNLRDSVRSLREKMAAANALSRDQALNIEIQHQQEQLIKSLKAQVSQLEADQSLGQRRPAAAPHRETDSDTKWLMSHALRTSQIVGERQVSGTAAVSASSISNSRRRGVLGLQIEASAPYRVLNISELMNEHGNIINDAVNIADELVEVDNIKCSNMSTHEVFSRLGGQAGSLLPLRFKDHVTSTEYGIVAKRHISIEASVTSDHHSYMHTSQSSQESFHVSSRHPPIDRSPAFV